MGRQIERALTIGLALVVGCAEQSGPRPPGDRNPDASTESPTQARPSVILMIGDGMGPGQLEAASLYRHGQLGALAMQSLRHRGQLTTASLSGITDSAAAATLMATGYKTLNGNIGVDATEAPLETIVEWASSRRLATGLVSTAAMPHATPGAFSAHRSSRHDLTAIADDQVRLVQPTVMLGGGARYLLPAGPGSERTDEGLLGEIEAAGYDLVTTAAELAADQPDADLRVWGMFADEHMAYEGDRTAEQPALAEMSLRALDILDRDPDGFFLMIEGARIDMASHGNDIDNAVGDTLAFDDSVAAVRDWIGDRDDILLIVTADHECGGLAVEQAAGAGTMPQVSWRWDQHTNARVDVFAEGPGADRFADSVLDHSWVHAAMIAQLGGAGLAEPATVITPDGRAGDLRHVVVDQLADTGFGIGFNELRSIRVDADARGVGVAGTGVFQWQENAIVVLIDVDYGAGTGVRDVATALTDSKGRIDAILSSVPVIGPAEFGAELAAASWGAQDARREDLWADAGLRGLIAPYGSAANLGWHGVALTFGEGVRAIDGAIAGTDGEGFELFIAWDVLYPTLAGRVPPGAEIAVAAAMVNDDGGYLSNQVLPPFAAGTANPGRNATPLPGVIVFPIDSDGDGIGDGASSPRVIAGRVDRISLVIVRIVAGVVLVAWVAGTAAADTSRVAFASALTDNGAVTIIESLRLGIANEGLVALGDGELRIALEQPIGAAAGESVDEAIAALASAKDAYASFEYDTAMTALERVDDALRSIPTSDQILAIAADRHLLAGLVHAGQRAHDRAMESFRLVHRIDPTRRKLDPGIYAPAVVELYRRALASTVERVEVALAIEPAAAELWIDGQRVPPGRNTIGGVAVGLHRVAVAADRHRPTVKMVDITQRQPRISVALEPTSAVEQIRQVRARLATASAASAAWQVAGAELARLAGVPLLVIVRRGAGKQTFEAAMFRTANGKLGHWIPVPSSRFFSELHTRVRTQVPATALRADIDHTRSGPRSWYQTWWGRGILVGAGVIAIGGVIYGVTASGEDGVDIDDWCFGQECR